MIYDSVSVLVEIDKTMSEKNNLELVTDFLSIFFNYFSCILYIWHRFILPLPHTFRMVKNHFFKVTQNRFYKLIMLLKVYMPSN